MTEENFWLKQFNQYKDLSFAIDKKYESWQPARWASNKAMLERIFKKINFNICSALELGAGSAALSLELARSYDVNCTCVDMCYNARKYALLISKDMNIDIKYLVGDFFKLNLPKADFVFSLGVIEHMDKYDQIKYIRKCKELTNKYILIAIPNQQSIIFNNYINWCNKNNNDYNEEHLEFSLPDLKMAIEQEGFKVIDEDGFQIFLSEGKFWQDNKIDVKPLINEMKLYDEEKAKNFPNYDFKFDDRVYEIY